MTRLTFSTDLRFPSGVRFTPHAMKLRHVKSCAGLTWGLLLLVTTAHSLPAATAPTGGEDKELVRQLLNENWENNSTAKKKVEELASRVSNEDPDPLDAYALGLTHIKQGKYVSAIDWMRLSYVTDDNNLAARRANIWLLARTRQHNRALQELAELLTRINEAPELPVEEHDELIRFAGRMMGFYAGPASDQVASATLDRYSRQILLEIKEADLDAFDESRDKVLADYENAVERADSTEADAEVDAVEDQKRIIAALEDQQMELQNSIARIRPQLDQLRADAQRDLGQIESKDEPLASDMDRLNSQAISLDSELGLVISDINRLEWRASREKDPYFRDRFLYEADRLRITARRIESDLINVDSRLGRVATQRRDLRAEYANLERQYDRQIERIVDELEKFQKAQRRTDAQLVRARRGPDVDMRRVRTMKAQLNAITTYEEFPLESERARLLKLAGAGE